MRNFIKSALLFVLILSVSFTVPIQSSGVASSVNAQSFADNLTEEKVYDKIEEKVYTGQVLNMSSNL